MKIELSPTNRVVRCSGVPARIWEGKTESGAPIFAFIARVAVSQDATAEEQAEFERQLHEQHPPSAGAEAFPLRMVL